MVDAIEICEKLFDRGFLCGSTRNECDFSCHSFHQIYFLINNSIRCVSVISDTYRIKIEKKSQAIT